MLVKLNPVIIFSRQKVESIQKPLTRKQWIQADRIVMAVLSAATVAMVVVFS